MHAVRRTAPAAVPGARRHTPAGDPDPGRANLGCRRRIGDADSRCSRPSAAGQDLADDCAPVRGDGALRSDPGAQRWRRDRTGRAFAATSHEWPLRGIVPASGRPAGRFRCLRTCHGRGEEEMKTPRYSLIALAAILACRGARGQEEGRALTGVVEDEKAGVLLAAKLTLTNKASGAELKAKLDDEGQFRFKQVAPGDYTLKAKAEGFETVELSVKIRNTEPKPLRIRMRVKSKDEEVTVTSEKIGRA